MAPLVAPTQPWNCTGLINERTWIGSPETGQSTKPIVISQGVEGLNLVLSDKVFSLLILVAWGMVNQNQDDAR